MANPTTNYGWPMPTSTDLVTDLPADFAAFGQPVDTSLKALNPETTLGDIAYRSATSNTNTRLGIGTNGQVLAVSGGVPAWTTTADVTPLTTKGDLFTFDTADARLGVGTNGQTLVADSTASTGLAWATPSSGGMTVIASGAHSGTTIDISSIAATYNYLYFTWSDYLPTTDGDYLRMRFNNVATANYGGGFGNEDLSVAVTVGALQISQTQDNVAADGQGAVTILDYKNSTSWKFTQSVALTNDPTTSANVRAARIWGFWNNTSAINRIQVVTVSGNSFNLNYVLYGVK